MSAPRIFGREPAVWVSLISGILGFVVTLNIPGLSSEQAGLISGLIFALAGAYTAWATKLTNLSAWFAVAKAALAVGVGYGLSLTVEQQGILLGLVSVALGLANRTQNSPASDSIPDLSGGVTEDVTTPFVVPAAEDYPEGEAGTQNPDVAVTTATA